MSTTLSPLHRLPRILLVVTILCVSAAISNAQDDLSSIEKQRAQELIASLVRNSYVDTIEITELWDGAIEGMITRLDPHSSYMPPETYDDFSERLRGNFQGIGITFAIIDDKITVIEVIEGGPSKTAGISSRDRIVTIDGENAVGLDSEEVKERLRGPAGSRVRVEVERPGHEGLLPFPITRDQVDLNSVSHAYMLDETTGYVSLSQFSLRSHYDVQVALERLKKQGMERLVFDLRSNSGGSLDAAIQMVDAFIQDGVIVSVSGRTQDQPIVYQATGRAQYADVPMIVMINHGSASASEIVAGALQDHDRALVMGQTSFGKGLVMNPFPLQDHGRDLGTLMLTIARYYTPSGRLIQRPYDGTREEYLEEGYDDYDPNAAEVDKTNRPIFRTDLGREVYGGGGITPDILLSGGNILNVFERDLRATNLMFQFADQYLNRHKPPRDFNEFLSSYHIPDDELVLFHDFVREHGISSGELTPLRDEFEAFADKHGFIESQRTALEEASTESGIDLDVTLFEQSLEFIDRELKMEIARMIWGTEWRYRVWHREDADLIEAMTYFDQARDLLQRRLAIGTIEQ